ncbi:MAG: hypothetical protein L0Y64_24605 [Myxococcaceae bacterium]|nr:hypothetical protein [Myxococcaceae bacterium]
METTVLVVLACVALVAWLLWRGPGRTARLRARYLRALHQPPAEAEATLARQLAKVRGRFPDRSEAWYLEWLLKDLARDRR